MVLNVIFSTISVISWRSVLFDGGNRSTRKKTDLSQVTDTLYHIMLYGEDFVMNRVRTPNFSGDRQ